MISTAMMLLTVVPITASVLAPIAVTLITGLSSVSPETGWSLNHYAWHGFDDRLTPVLFVNTKLLHQGYAPSWPRGLSRTTGSRWTQIHMLICRDALITLYPIRRRIWNTHVVAAT